MRQLSSTEIHHISGGLTGLEMVLIPTVVGAAGSAVVGKYLIDSNYGTGGMLGLAAGGIVGFGAGVVFGSSAALLSTYAAVSAVPATAIASGLSVISGLYYVNHKFF